MTDDNTRPADDGGMDMPLPPDLGDLYREHQQKMQDAYAAARSAFDVFKFRDQQMQALIQTYETEMKTVFTIAKAVVNQPTAAASVAPVLAVANAAFMQGPATDALVSQKIRQSFSRFQP